MWTISCLGSRRPSWIGVICGSARRACHHRGHDWAFHCDGIGDEEEESIFRFDRHRFVAGEYVPLTEHDGPQRTFRVAEVLLAP